MTAEHQIVATVRRSPLSHLADELAAGSAGEVSLAELPFRTMIDLRAQHGAAVRGRLSEALGLALPERAGAAVQEEPRHALWLGPDWWLIADQPEPRPRLESELAGTLRSAGHGQASAVDVSAHRTTLALAGPHARDVLEHGCSLDLHPRAFGPGSCAQTMVAKAQVVLHQTAACDYRILVRASFADYLARWLLDAMTEYVTAR